MVSQIDSVAAIQILLTKLGFKGKLFTNDLPMPDDNCSCHICLDIKMQLKEFIDRIKDVNGNLL